jgi:hypothetical protein
MNDEEIKKYLDGLLTEFKTELKQVKELIAKEKNVTSDECNWFNTEQVLQCYPISKNTLIKERKAGNIIAKRLSNGVYMYPKSQFVYREKK